MREIKFRVWDAHKRMWTEYRIHDGVVYFLDKSTGVWVGKYDKRYKEFDFMEYSGLRDKNNKEIYEGDIVVQNNKRHRVIFDEENARFCIRDDEFELNVSFTNMNNKRMEVVGNIYENPELIKEVR